METRELSETKFVSVRDKLSDAYLNSIDANGLLTFGSRIRRLNDLLVKQVVELYNAHGIKFKPPWFPIVLALKQVGTMDIKSLAQRLKTTHSSASQLVKELSHNGLIKVEVEKNDLRQRNISLTDKGYKTMETLVPHLKHIVGVFNRIFNDDAPLILSVLDKFEAELKNKSLLERASSDLNEENSFKDEIKVLKYNDMFKFAFYELNKAWITKYFEMEAEDELYLGDPKGQIVDKGGEVFIAVNKMLPVGTLAILHMSDCRAKLEKMSVHESMQGKGIGQMLMQRAVDYCKEKGYKEIFLETNSVLKPAISLYHKNGFKDLPKQETPYNRADTFMLKDLVAK